MLHTATEVGGVFVRGVSPLMLTLVLLMLVLLLLMLLLMPVCFRFLRDIVRVLLPSTFTRRLGPLSSMNWWRSFGKTRLDSSFFWEVLRRNPGRITVLCLIGIQTVFGETNGPTVKQRAGQHRG